MDSDISKNINELKSLSSNIEDYENIIKAKIIDIGKELSPIYKKAGIYCRTEEFILEGNKEADYCLYGHLLIDNDGIQLCTREFSWEPEDIYDKEINVNNWRIKWIQIIIGKNGIIIKELIEGLVKEAKEATQDRNSSFQKVQTLLAKPIENELSNLMQIHSEYDPSNVEEKVIGAIEKFNRQLKDDALKDLAGVLEFLKEKGELKKVITNKDTEVLSKIANNFDIRHHDENHKGNYDKSMKDWIFYYYLNTIQMVLKLIASS